jgi:DNA-nicking Smr family endonuclease
MKRTLGSDDGRVWRYVCRRVTPMGQHEVLRTAPPLRTKHAEPLLDLHNLTIASAHAAALDHIQRCSREGITKVTIVTGKSGPISTEFPHWLHNRSEVRRSAPLNDGGAWEVWLKRST